MKLHLVSILALALAAACNQGTGSAARAQSGEITSNDGLKPDQELVDTNVVFDKTNGVFTYRSPFEPATTLKLNKIVEKARDSIAKFDDQVPAIRKTVASGAGASPQSDGAIKAQQALKSLDAMQQPALVAKTEIEAAKLELIASKKYFSNIVLSGMIKFIDEVNSEFADEKKTLSAKLNKS